jgi:carboxypeptidase PM20D1
MKRPLLALGALVLLTLVVLAAVLVVRTLALEPAGQPVAAAPDDDRDGEVDLAAVERLAGAVRIQTVSGPGERSRPGALRRFRRYLAESFPRVHQTLVLEEVAGASLLYTWASVRDGVGEGVGGGEPLLLMAHQDVVPAEAPDRWTHPPFSGAVDGGFVWGRGTMDDKGSLMAILEAAEGLLRDGFRPQRPVLLAFGHDEEIGGTGAAAVADLVRERGFAPMLVLDEGLAVTEGMMPGLGETPVALVGVAEKGYLSVELRAAGEGGHSSAPPRQTAVDVLARALLRLREAPLPAGIDGPVEELLTTVAPRVGFGQRLALANLWLFEPLVVRQLAASPGTDALLRTTTAPTMLSASVKDNVLPTRASAVVNFRLHPRDSAESVLGHVRAVVDDPRVEVLTYGGFASRASPVAPTDGPAWDLLTAAVARVVPEAVVAPSLVLGGTDSRHYTGLTPHVYRFVPFTVRPGDLERVHGVDERLALEDYGRMVCFYRELILAAASRGETG